MGVYYVQEGPTLRRPGFLNRRDAHDHSKQTDCNYPKISKYCKPLGFVKLQYCNLIKIKIPAEPHQNRAKPHHRKPLRPAQNVLEEDDIMWQLNDRDLYADRQSTDLLFVYQTHWQRSYYVKKYGNKICLFDATWKTS